MFCPCETRTSTCRSFATISSGLYRFLAIAVLLDVKDIPQAGPLQWGWITDPNKRLPDGCSLSFLVQFESLLEMCALVAKIPVEMGKVGITGNHRCMQLFPRPKREAVSPTRVKIAAHLICRIGVRRVLILGATWG